MSLLTRDKLVIKTSAYTEYHNTNIHAYAEF
jgi:hypothetical protein